MSDCKHERFQCSCAVTRISDEQDPEKIIGYATDIKVHCIDCGQPFEWIGIPMGLSMFEPMVSADGLELRAPMRPSGLPIEKIEGKIYN